MTHRLGMLVAAAFLYSISVATVRAASLHDPAPPITSDVWINTRPLVPSDLAGRVVIVEFWTFDCINCVRTVPAVRELHRRYGRSAVVIGVHTPEFGHERDPANVRHAVKRLGVTFPVALDNRRAVWRAYGIDAWPSIVIVDRRGRIRWRHVGELHQGTAAWRAATRLLDQLVRDRA